MIDLVVRSVIPAALSLLPPEMDTPAARAMLIAIGLQESKFLARRQILDSGRPGPAAGFWQFERGGAVVGVLEHPSTREHALRVLRELRYVKGALPGRVTTSTAIVHATLEDNDILACAFARLNLWWFPSRLPHQGAAADGWRQYLATWQPGKPHKATWAAYFAEAWDRVTAIEETPV